MHHPLLVPLAHQALQACQAAAHALPASLQVPASHRKALPSPATPASAQNGSLKAGRRVRFDGAQVQGTAPEAPLSAAEAAVSSPAAESSPTPGSAPQPAQGAGKQGPEQPSSGKAGRKKRKAQDDAGSTPAAKRPAEYAPALLACLQCSIQVWLQISIADACALLAQRPGWGLLCVSWSVPVNAAALMAGSVGSILQIFQHRLSLPAAAAVPTLQRVCFKQT